ncbi:hypothetical protein GIB64_03110 [Pseudomonas lactis]|uniref:hypothetical protein n=1 Tax=Pseudomonas TaxID=286 RepID=UPI000BB5F081|nr:MULTISPECIES: hypothetical protein [Pseudomonas]MBA5956409.1 hypothetical protein [Pseudomonas lactis]PRW80264.1 hypothetical protein C7A12_03540 [Pseudomonas fluorescens]PRW81039.1 hypothetical protein C7A13_07415 [Pseudomonas fluorescens]
MKGLLALLMVSLMVSGCGIKTQSDRAMDDFKARQRDEAVIQASGQRVSINDYYRSRFSQKHDVKGFLAYSKSKEANELAVKRAKFAQDFPLLLKRTKACVMRNDFLSEKELQINAKQCFPYNFNNGLTPPAWSNEVIDKAVADLSPHFDQVRAQMKAEARQRAAEDRQQAAQDKRDREAEAKRAYDNSLRSLVE